jgi:polysaccharide biosynthesis protein PslH
MKILIVATKAPWPPVDGGRFLLRNTLEALTAAGHRPVLVAPVDPARFDLTAVAAELAGCCEPRLVPAAPGRPLPSALRSWVSGMPLSVARHALPAVRREVGRCLAGERFDVVHAEQLQALPQTASADSRGVPVVLRAQNVESDLWAETARRSPGWRGRRSLDWRGRLLAVEARRLARWEGEAVRRSTAVLALTAEDAARLRVLAAGQGDIRIVRAAFPDLPASAGPPLPGTPAVVVLGSQGWLPNEDSVGWFLAEVWPLAIAALPGAVLHLFGAAPPGPLPAGVIVHPPPRESAEAFAPGSILAVPLRIGSGVRIKVLEAWARGVPVVGTPAALAGLEVENGREALVAGDPQAFAAALGRLASEPGLAARLVEEGRRARRERHDPVRIAEELLRAYPRCS